MFSVTIPKEQGKERSEALTSLSWMLRCFIDSVESSHVAGSERREEASQKARDIIESLRDEINEKEWYDLTYGIEGISRQKTVFEPGYYYIRDAEEEESEKGFDIVYIDGDHDLHTIGTNHYEKLTGDTINRIIGRVPDPVPVRTETITIP